MRTIVALFVCSFAFAQTPVEIDRMTKAVADHPDDLQRRVGLLGSLTNRNVALPPATVREMRRAQILWLIEHHPDAAADIYALPQLVIPAKGRLADPAGAAEAAALWKEIVARPGVKADVVANAAIYFRAVDPAYARILLEGQPDNPAFSQARGLLDGALVVGMTGIGQRQRGRQPSQAGANDVRSGR